MKTRIPNARLLGSMLLLLAVAIPLPLVMADTHYVDSAAQGSNNGSSWANAWKSFSSINWSLVTAGDTLQISGGSASKTYNETLTVGSSGASGQPIVITGGRDAGHTGTVIIDAQGSRSNCVVLSSRRYVTVRNLSLRNATGSGQCRLDGGGNNIVENLTIYVTGHGGVWMQNTSNVIVRGCTITTPTNTSAQTDGIYAQRNTNAVYENNHIVVSNNNASPHCDAIQLYVETNAVVRGNYVQQVNSKTSNAQGIYATTCTGTLYVYNNVAVNAHGNNGIALRNLTAGNASFYVYNNTVITGGYWGIYLSECADPRFKNNIVYHSGSSGRAIAIYNWAGSAANIDYNCVWTPSSSSPFYFNGSSNSWSQWRGRGFDAHGLNVDPKVDAARVYALTSGSPAINRAVSLSSVFNVDRLGVARGSAWDIGAYEYGGTVVPVAPANPRNLRIVS